MKIINSSLQCRYLHISLSLVFHRQTSDCDYDFAKKRHTKTHTHTKFTKQTDKVYGWIGLHYHIIMIIIYDRPSSELAVLNGCVCATISNWCKIRECFISFLCIVRSYIKKCQAIISSTCFTIICFCVFCVWPIVFFLSLPLFCTLYFYARVLLSLTLYCTHIHCSQIPNKPNTRNGC